MFGQNLTRYLLVVGGALLLAGCLPVDEMVFGRTTLAPPAAPRHVAQWADQQLMFVADSRMGRVQSYQLGGPQPVFQAQTEIASRRWVLDLQIDAKGGQLWVLGDDGLTVHDARTLALQAHIPLIPNTVASMRIEDGQISLVSGDGTSVGAVDCRTLLASWRAPLSRS